MSLPWKCCNYFLELNICYISTEVCVWMADYLFTLKAAMSHFGRLYTPSFMHHCILYFFIILFFWVFTITRLSTYWKLLASVDSFKNICPSCSAFHIWEGNRSFVIVIVFNLNLHFPLGPFPHNLEDWK